VPLAAERAANRKVYQRVAEFTVACPCGVVFERWVTAEDAAADLLRAAALN
jgi:hypothetical protein